MHRFPLTIGIWKLLILNQMQIISATKFVVMPSDSSDIRSNGFTLMETIKPKTNIMIENVVSTFIKLHNVFFNPLDNLFWYIESVCFEILSYNNYSLLCKPSPVVSCNKANWNSDNIKLRYLL